MASPTERADKVRETYGRDSAGRVTDTMLELLPPGSQVVAPEDIRAGWRVLTPEQAEAERAAHLALVRLWGAWLRGYPVEIKAVKARLEESDALLAGVPGKDSDT